MKTRPVVYRFENSKGGCPFETEVKQQCNSGPCIDSNGPTVLEWTAEFRHSIENDRRRLEDDLYTDFKISLIKELSGILPGTKSDQLRIPSATRLSDGTKAKILFLAYLSEHTVTVAQFNQAIRVRINDPVLLSSIGPLVGSMQVSEDKVSLQEVEMNSFNWYCVPQSVLSQNESSSGTISYCHSCIHDDDRVNSSPQQRLLFCCKSSSSEACNVVVDGVFDALCGLHAMPDSYCPSSRMSTLHIIIIVSSVVLTVLILVIVIWTRVHPSRDDMKSRTGTNTHSIESTINRRSIFRKMTGKHSRHHTKDSNCSTTQPQSMTTFSRSDPGDGNLVRVTRPRLHRDNSFLSKERLKSLFQSLFQQHADPDPIDLHGDCRVVVYYDYDDSYCVGHINRKSAFDGSYEVHFEDGDQDDCVDLSCIRMVPPGAIEDDDGGSSASGSEVMAPVSVLLSFDSEDSFGVNAPSTTDTKWFYDVKLDVDLPLGLDLAMGNDQVLVSGLSQVDDKVGPAELSGSIHDGDCLVSVYGKPVTTLEDAVEVIHSFTGLAIFRFSSTRPRNAIEVGNVVEIFNKNKWALGRLSTRTLCGDDTVKYSAVFDDGVEETDIDASRVQTYIPLGTIVLVQYGGVGAAFQATVSRIFGDGYYLVHFSDGETEKIPREWILVDDHKMETEFSKDQAIMDFLLNAYDSKSPSDGFDYFPNVSNRFKVVLDTKEGLGLKLGLTRIGLVVVTGFHVLPNGSKGPAELCDSLNVRDVLLAVDEVSVKYMSFEEISSMIKSATSRITLDFGRL